MVTILLNEGKECYLPQCVWITSFVLKGFVELGSSETLQRYNVPFDESTIQLWKQFYENPGCNTPTKHFILPEWIDNISYLSEMLRLCHYLDIRHLYSILVDHTASSSMKGTWQDIANKLEFKAIPSMEQRKKIYDILYGLDDDQ